MERIAVVESATPMNLPQPMIRADLAWALFWPETPAGALPPAGGDALMPWAQRLWNALGRVTGFLRHVPEAVWVMAPPCDPTARELLTRLVSFWSTEIYWVPSKDVDHPQFAATRTGGCRLYGMSTPFPTRGRFGRDPWCAASRARTIT
jgi:hypothetical protein